MEIDTDLPTGGKVTVVGVGAVLVSAFLPWFGAETPAGVSPTTTGIDTTIGLLVLLLALVVGLVVVLVEWDVKTVAASAGGGGLVALLALLKFADLGGVTGAKVGLYLALVGGIVMLVGGLVGYSQSAESAGDPLGG